MGQAIPEVTAETAGGRPPAVARERASPRSSARWSPCATSRSPWRRASSSASSVPVAAARSTLLRIVAGLERQNLGVVRMRGARHVSALPPSRRNYGIVFQSYALFPNLTVARNVAYGLETRRAARAKIEARVDELARTVDLRSHKQHYPAQLSGGQQQRVALARALAPSLAPAARRAAVRPRRAGAPRPCGTR